MKRLLPLIFLILAASSAFGQGPGSGGPGPVISPVTHGTAVPTTCVKGRLYTRDSNGHLYTSNNGTCLDLSTAASAGGSNTQVQFNDSSVFGGDAGFVYNKTTDTATLGALLLTTTVNKITLTPPATSATITIADGKTFTVSNTLTLAGTDGSTLNVGTGGTLGSNAFTSTAYVPQTRTITTTSPITIGGGASADLSSDRTIACATCGVTGSPLSQFAATTSAQLRGVLSDESGTGVAFFQGGSIGAATGISLNMTDNLTFGTGSTGNQLQSVSGTAFFLDVTGVTAAKVKANDFAANWLHTYSDVSTDTGRNWITGISNRMTMLSTFTMGFVSSSSDAFGAPDTAFTRAAAGVWGVTNSIAPVTNAAGDLGTTSLRWKQLWLDATITAGGTTGNQTINKAAGTVNVAAAGTAVTVTNSLVTASSLVFTTLRTNDTTCRMGSTVPASGSFTINLTAACTAEVSIGFIVINQ